MCARPQSCPTLWEPRDYNPYSPPGSFFQGIFQTGILEQVAFSYSRGSSQPRDQTHDSILDWQMDSLPLVSLVIVIHISPPSGVSFSSPPHPPLGHHRPPGWAFCYILTANPHQLTVIYTVVYPCWCYFLHSSHSLLSRLCPQVHSLDLSSHSFPENWFINTIFLDPIRMHYYMIFVFLFLTDFTLFNRLWVHPPH